MRNVRKYVVPILIIVLTFKISVFAYVNKCETILKNEGAYIYGFTDTYIGANESVTRAEASTMIYRLLKQNNAINNYIKPNIATYIDVPKDTWYFAAVEFMTFKGVYSANEMKNIFLPYVPITRAEVARLFVISLDLEKNKSIALFDDINIDCMYFDHINTMAGNGYMVGDASGNTIRPKSYLTRAEFVVIYNRIIGRNKSYSTSKTITGDKYICPFKDLDKNNWYYDDIVRATNCYTSRKIDLSKRNDRNSLDEFEIR